MPENEKFEVIDGTDPLELGDPQLDMPGAGLVPVVVSITPSMPNAGADVTVTVYMSQTAQRMQAVAIVGTSQFWVDLPDHVYVLDGCSTVTFPATLTTTATGEGTVTASCNGGSAQGEAWVHNASSAAA